MSRKPNILLIISDDHGYGDRSALGHCPDVSTPALDRLAAQGISYSDAYVTAPICSPSRSSLIVGAHQKRWGGHWFNDSTMAPEEFRTLPERLADDGYRTGYFGKVHYGHEKPGDRACPEQHGFHEVYYGLAAGQMGRLNYMRHSKQAIADYGDEASWRMAVQPMFEGADGEVSESELEGFLTDELGSRTREFIASGPPDQPFFAMLAFNAVHNFCWQLPEDELAERGLPPIPDWSAELGSYADWYEEAIQPNLANGRAYYLAQLELMDRQIGLVLDQLEASGIAEDTLVIYLTDNGGSTCNYGSNAPLSGTKYTLFEGGIRVPLLLRWSAGGLSGGEVRQQLASSLDIVPTVLHAAGVAPDGLLDGINLGQERALETERELHWDCGWQWAVRRGDWKLAWVDPESAVPEMIRKIEHAEAGSGYRLHNLAEDIAEQRDLYSQHPDIVQELLTAREQWLAQLECD